jgi:hypothetical protein
MQRTVRKLLCLSALTLLVVNKDDEKVSKNNLSEHIRTNTLDYTESNFPKERVRLGIKKQSLIRLEQTIGEQRGL